MGFVTSEDGYIVTNNHVIEAADEIIIEFYEGGELEAKVIGTDRPAPRLPAKASVRRALFC